MVTTVPCVDRPGVALAPTVPRPGVRRPTCRTGRDAARAGRRPRRLPDDGAGATPGPALINNPAAVRADESIGDLDSTAPDAIMGLIERLNCDQDQAFVIVTHDPGIAAGRDRIIRMKDGRVDRAKYEA